MKNKTLIIITFIILVCLPLKALADEVNFGAGSLIIPMDSFYQQEADGGILEAYGLVFYLLDHTVPAEDSDDPPEHDIAVYWIVNQLKTTIDAIDFEIEDTNLPSSDVAAAVKIYDHAGSTSTLTYNTGDTLNKVTYAGAPFIIDAADADAAKAIINTLNWDAVEVHEAMVPFKAPVYREMRGTPPRIALMNNSENHEGGNATILESYLRLAGICSDLYDVVTPCEIRDDILTKGKDGNLGTGDEYDFLWAPHWTGEDSYNNDDDQCAADGDAVTEVVEIIQKTREFLEAGKGLLAECASIEVFEFNSHGRFLTDKGFAHNGGTDNAADIIYNDVTTPNAQVGDFEFDPEGGHLHNWRPFEFSDKAAGNFNFGADETPVETDGVTDGNPSVYNDTVNRFTLDNTGWDYYVGGYLDGNNNNGYVVYLGGHKYAKCGGKTSTVEIDPQPEIRLIEFEFDKGIKTDADNKEHFTLKVEYDSGSETRITFNAAEIGNFTTSDVSDLTVSTLSIDSDDSRYQWTRSVDADEYFLHKKGWVKSVDPIEDGDPLISEPSDVILDVTPLTRKYWSNGVIVANQWDYGDIDSLGFNTIYVELPDGDDVDTLGDDPTGENMTAEFPITTGTPTPADAPLDLEIDLSTATRDNKKIKNVTFRNTGSSAITVDSMTFYWTGGEVDQKLKKIKDPDFEFYKDPKLASGEPTAADDFTTFTIDVAAGEAEAPAAGDGCTNNSDCSWTNIAGVRYILNTLFNIKFQISDQEFARAAPVVSHPYLYQGSFDYPSYEGHFRRYTVTDENVTAAWDTADQIPNAGTGNLDGRQVYTSQYVNGAWERVDFDAANISDLRVPLDVTPLNEDDSDEIAVITRVRGKYWDADLDSSPPAPSWKERDNKLGAIMHSAPVIVESNSRSHSTRDETAYVGDLYGMLHAIETEYPGDDETGDEKWAYIPSNMLNKLQNDRTDENAPQSFAAVDGSPTAADIYYDHDNDDDTDKQWRTVLVSPQGSGGNYIFALDITEPDLTATNNWETGSQGFKVLWEITVETILNYSGSGGFSVGDTVIGVNSGATGVVTDDDTDGVLADDDTDNADLTLEDVVGAFEVGETVFVDADPDGTDGTLDEGEPSATVENVVEMGRAFRAALDRVKWPVYVGNNIANYESKAVVFVATGFARIAQSQGGVNVFAFELKTGKRLWYFSSRYSDSVNDIPGAVTPFDTTGDGFVDQVFVGDMNGRMWQLDAEKGSNPYGVDETDTSDAGKEIPLWNAGVGNPISVSPAIVKVNPVIVVFGTGGTDWAANDKNYYLYAINSTDKNSNPTYTSGGGTSYWTEPLMLPEGEKVWSTPTIAAGQIFLSTSIGSMESTNPKDDLASGAGRVMAINLTDGNETWSITTGKARGSLYVDRGHVYLTTLDNELVQIGADDFSETDTNKVRLKSWRQLD